MSRPPTPAPPAGDRPPDRSPPTPPTRFASKAFFCNSGTEANEAAIKFCRKAARVRAEAGGLPGRPFLRRPPTEFVACSNGFHGRTMGALALTAKEQYKKPFAPLVSAPGRTARPPRRRRTPPAGRC